MATISKEEQEDARRKLQERAKKSAPAPALVESTVSARDRQLLKAITEATDPVEKRRLQDEYRAGRASDK